MEIDLDEVLDLEDDTTRKQFIRASFKNLFLCQNASKKIKFFVYFESIMSLLNNAFPLWPGLYPFFGFYRP